MGWRAGGEKNIQRVGKQHCCQQQSYSAVEEGEGWTQRLVTGWGGVMVEEKSVKGD